MGYSIGKLFGSKLSTKIIGILVGFFLCALVAISTTLLISWRLEGVAAAINDTGSLRMGVWKLAHLVSEQPEDGTSGASAEFDLLAELERLDHVHARLESGDPTRPLLVPSERTLPAAVKALGEQWRRTLRPLIEAVLYNPDNAVRAEARAQFQSLSAESVARIDRVVSDMEASFATNTDILRSSQVVLIVLAVFGTVGLIRFFFLAVIRPVHSLHEGIQRMQREEFDARVPVLTRDEFGDLSEGFNQMADHLQQMYATLEERVETKTRHLAERNRELRILYDVSHFLREPLGIEQISRGFMQRVQTTFGASAASVRLVDSSSGDLYLTTHHGLNHRFVEDEAILNCGDCMCGAAISNDGPVVANLAAPTINIARADCAAAGFKTICAVPIVHGHGPIGIFNLFFATPRELDEGDRRLLENLGQHLAMAITHLRLQARDRELAVSEERNIIARELHDSIAQELAFVNIQVQILRSLLGNAARPDISEVLDRIHNGIQLGYANVRELLQHFRARFDAHDLKSAVKAALAKFTQQTDIPCDLDFLGNTPTLDDESKVQILYIVQEALSNIRKHAQANRVRVRVEPARDEIRISVADDGIGFAIDSRAETGFTDHIGLHIMNERAARIGGNLKVESQPGHGTTVTLSFKHMTGNNE